MLMLSGDTYMANVYHEVRIPRLFHAIVVPIALK
jgi:hypothetical protein